MKVRRPAPTGSVITALACAVPLLAGCAAGDVQLNGKLFDYIGLNSANKGRATKMAARAPLVVPPGLQNLPQPGSGSTETGALAEIKDPDGSKVENSAELERQQAEYCKKNYELPKARGDDTVDGVKGPLGECRRSLLTALPKLLNDQGEEE